MAQNDKILKKIKKEPGDATMLHVCTKNQDLYDACFLRY